jgi:glutamate dehydrogenase
MHQTLDDLRSQTLALVDALTPADSGPVAAVIAVWLAALDAEDLADMSPASLAPLLWNGFTQMTRFDGDCKIAQLRYADGRGGMGSALLILNDDMPYLVDSIVMAMRKQGVALRGVMNAVLPLQRDADGNLQSLAPGSPADNEPGASLESTKLESYVLCLLAEDLEGSELAALVASLQMVAHDASSVQRDRGAMAAHVAGIASKAAAQGAEGCEVAAFMEWAGSEGFEFFGYAYYRVKPGERELERDLPGRLGVLADTSHPLYGTCLAHIPGDFDNLCARADTLAIAKADIEGNLHRDQQLDFIGVRDTDHGDTSAGTILGEHCFVGLFTRAQTAMPLAHLPFARGRVARVLTLAGVRREGFRAEKFIEILESLPRTEVLEAEPEWLAHVCSAVVSLYKQPRTKVFARRDLYGRHLNVLVYLPRERFSASLAKSLAQALHASSGAKDVSRYTLVADGPLARLYLIAHGARNPLDMETDILQPLLAVLDGWHAGFAALLDNVFERDLRASLRKLGANLPPDYMALTAPDAALRDLDAIVRNVQPSRIAARIEFGNSIDHSVSNSVGTDAGNAEGAGEGAGEAARARTTIRLYSGDRVPSLSTLLPALQNAGIAIDREQTWAIKSDDGHIHCITSLSVDAASAAKLARPGVAPVAQQLFAALFNDDIEDGRLNGLVIEGGLHVREVQLVRAYVSYWRQTGSRFSVRYIADCLRKQAGRVKALVDAFLQRFDPSLSDQQHAAALAAMGVINDDLASVNHADTEAVLGALVDLMQATLRTNYFQSKQSNEAGMVDAGKIIFKFDTSHLDLLPEPRPYREIFVFSRRFEGLHLRGGPVARGGLRWSDRMEDYRTEVLGLVKAQMVKNAVIVPAGAKGGFVCKQIPLAAPRDVVAAEGEAVYRMFVESLLEVTDNRELGQVIAPFDTVCYDGPDPYLVVAADKGTASFSDIANGIAVRRGFWLGDAFASGGSNGYDHKKLGITAKGAWEAVKRHFYEMEHDINSTPFTLVGVGDMSGDVFGNGMLLSRQLKLVAAFDHRHIFLDPQPDLAASFDERARLFALPRSSWDDYQRDLISEGGGVFARTLRTIALSPQIRAVLDIKETALAPEALMQRILQAPVDLFYNGGIGTYIKASNETHVQVKDRANDAIRVDGSAIRAKIVAEGGNLGATQAGRIEFALAGGRIFTDAIDNSAGVDCSDHEVNVKIWLDVEVNAGQLTAIERNTTLTAMTDDIERLVLRDNSLQTHLLVREAQTQCEPEVADGYAALIASLEEVGALSRELEQLPTVAELARRKQSGRCLTSPELAVVIANVKNRYKHMLAELPLTGQSWAGALLTPYFPPLLVATRSALDHPLANAILATVLANEAINRCGPLMIRDLAFDQGRPESDVMLAWAQAWSDLKLESLFEALDAQALVVPRAISIKVDARTRALQRTMMAGVLSMPAGQQVDAVGIEQLAQLFGAAHAYRQLMTIEVDATAGTAAVATVTASDASTDPYALAMADTPFVQAWQAVDAIEGVAGFLFGAMVLARPAAMDLAALLQLGLTLRRRAGIAALERGLAQTPHSASQAQLRNYARQALLRTQQRLLAHVLQLAAGGDASASDAAASDASASINAVVAAMGLLSHAAPDLEQSILDVWALSEAASAVLA